MIVVQVQWNLFVDTSSRVKSHKIIFDSKTDNIGQTNQTGANKHFVGTSSEIVKQAQTQISDGLKYDIASAGVTGILKNVSFLDIKILEHNFLMTINC